MMPSQKSAQAPKQKATQTRWAHRLLWSALIASGAITGVACGPANLLSPFRLTGSFSGGSSEDVATGATGPQPLVDHTQTAGQVRLTLQTATELRVVESDVLEVKVVMPSGTQLGVPENYEIEHLNYRKSDGSVDWSSTGFIKSVVILSVPAAHSADFPASRIASLNASNGGLFVFASIVGAIEGVNGNFAVIGTAAPGSGYLQNYESNGQAKHSFRRQLLRLFGDHLDKAVDPATQKSETRAKWQAIYHELKMAADRTVATPKALLMIDPARAVSLSIVFEKTGQIARNGAWSIATLGTARRHGFSNVPCAEFMSEMVREAYQRAGYKVTDDFNHQKKNPLIYTDSSRVDHFARFLYLAGWTPWDATRFRPPTGAFLMNAWADTPGHTYLAAGDNGRLIVDNGSPQGRDLHTTSLKTMNMMYQTGVFFLPPGVNPDPW